MPGATIRAYVEADLNRICEIAVCAWEPYFEQCRLRMGDELFDIVMGDNWAEKKKRDIRQHCIEYPEWCLVSEVEEGIVGFITWHLEPAVGLAEIGNNAILPDYQGNGYGTAQYERVLQIFRQHHMRFAKVQTGLDAFHGPARAAYENAGFVQMVPVVYYYQDLNK